MVNFPFGYTFTGLDNLYLKSCNKGNKSKKRSQIFVLDIDGWLKRKS